MSSNKATASRASAARAAPSPKPEAKPTPSRLIKASDEKAEKKVEKKIDDDRNQPILRSPSDKALALIARLIKKSLLDDNDADIEDVIKAAKKIDTKKVEEEVKKSETAKSASSDSSKKAEAGKAETAAVKSEKPKEAANKNQTRTIQQYTDSSRSTSNTLRSASTVYINLNAMKKPSSKQTTPDNKKKYDLDMKNDSANININYPKGHYNVKVVLRLP